MTGENRFIVDANVRRLAKKHGKRVSKSYLEWLTRRVHQTVLDSIHSVGSKVTLNAQDAEVYEAAKKMTFKRKRV